MRRHTSSQHYPKHIKAKTRAEAIDISKNGGKEPPAQYQEDELGESATSAQVKAYRNRIEKGGLRNVMRQILVIKVPIIIFMMPDELLDITMKRQLSI